MSKNDKVSSLVQSQLHLSPISFFLSKKTCSLTQYSQNFKMKLWELVFFMSFVNQQPYRSLASRPRIKFNPLRGPVCYTHFTASQCDGTAIILMAPYQLADRISSFHISIIGLKASRRQAELFVPAMLLEIYLFI